VSAGQKGRHRHKTVSENMDHVCEPLRQSKVPPSYDKNENVVVICELIVSRIAMPLNDYRIQIRTELKRDRAVKKNELIVSHALPNTVFADLRCLHAAVIADVYRSKFTAVYTP
jgi:hypothetical protein